ncbi:MAG: hypothetical protein VKL59_23305 [Nostocaceae cyanobacterium]|nr:hypothetical protein [Nostocaceae cyanobacterium]
MSEQKKQDKTSQQDVDTSASGGYQTPIEPEIRQTGTAVESEGKATAKPEAPENDSVQGSPNQGTESR